MKKILTSIKRFLSDWKEAQTEFSNSNYRSITQKLQKYYKDDSGLFWVISAQTSGRGKKNHYKAIDLVKNRKLLSALSPEDIVLVTRLSLQDKNLPSFEPIHDIMAENNGETVIIGYKVIQIDGEEKEILFSQINNDADLISSLSKKDLWRASYHYAINEASNEMELREMLRKIKSYNVNSQFKGNKLNE